MFNRRMLLESIELWSKCFFHFARSLGCLQFHLTNGMKIPLYSGKWVHAIYKSLTSYLWNVRFCLVSNYIDLYLLVHCSLILCDDDHAPSKKKDIPACHRSPVVPHSTEFI